MSIFRNPTIHFDGITLISSLRVKNPKTKRYETRHIYENKSGIKVLYVITNSTVQSTPYEITYHEYNEYMSEKFDKDCFSTKGVAVEADGNTFNDAVYTSQKHFNEFFNS